jgi:predicted permease
MPRNPGNLDRLRSLRWRLFSLFDGRRLDDALQEELRAHIELATEDNIARGMSRKQARREALRRLGGVTQTREAYRQQRGLPMFETLIHDIRYALRQLRKSPGFAATVILTLALGAGSVTAVFSVVYAVLIAPYGFNRPGQLVVWRETIQEIQTASPVLPDNYRHYMNLKSRAHSIEDAAILQNAGFSVEGASGHPQETEGLEIAPNFLSVLGVTPALGRAFTEEEAQLGRNNEILLTWPAWQRYFGGDPAAIGKTLRVDGKPKTLVGVLPRWFRFPAVSMMPGEVTHGSTERYEIFVPLAANQEQQTANDGEFNYLVIARLKPNVSVQQAQSELDGIEKSTAAADHLAVHLGVFVEPFAQEITGDYRKPLWLLFAAVAGVLLMVCVNLANLQIARGVAREPEIALRAALGANRSRLLQSALIENLLLGAAGGAMAIAFAFTAQNVLVQIASTLPRLNEVRLSLPMLALTLGLSLATSQLFGILPALRSLRVPPQRALQSSATRLSANRHATRSRRVLVTVEVALSVTLLIVTALVTRSFSRLLTQDRLFSADRVTLVKAELDLPKYSSGDDMPDDPGADPGSHARDAFIDRAIDAIAALPGVQSAAMTSVIPLTGEASINGLHRPDRPLPDSQVPHANQRFVSPQFFATLRIPILAGRPFNLKDRDHPRVAILSERAAKAAFPDENPIGRTLHHWGRDYTIVGIAADARINDLKHNSSVLYLPHWDFPPASPVFLVRSSRPSESLGPLIRQTLWSIDPEIAVPTLTTLDSQVGESVATERFQAILLSSFGAAALLLAVLGIYGVLTYSVSLRTQEFGIRLALGCSRGKLAQLVLLDAAAPTLAGIGFGLLGAAAASKWIGSLLYETSPADPGSIALSLALLLTAALLAALIPLRSATTVDPMQALRNE